VLDLVVGLAQPAGLSVMVALLVGGVVAVSRGEARRRPAHSADGVADAASLDAAAANELHRARRYGRPFSLITLTARRMDVVRLASDIRVSARITDVVGMVGRSTIVALLPETTSHEAPSLVRRIADLVDEEAASRAVVGVASFPQDGVTWMGLRASAQQSARSLAEFRMLQEGLVGKLRRDLGPAGSANPGAVSNFTAPPSAHAADPAA
jgi:hypothetical protein